MRGAFSLVLLTASESVRPFGILVWQVVTTAGLFVAYRVISKKPIIRQANLIHYAVLAVAVSLVGLALAKPVNHVH